MLNDLEAVFRSFESELGLRPTQEGGDGNDFLWGDEGNDYLFGDSGKDFFIFNTSLNESDNLDTIADF